MTFDKKAWMKTYARTHRAAFNRRTKQWRLNLRLDILTHYGGQCVCCGYSDLTKQIRGLGFLQIDHISGGGRKEFIKLRKWGTAFYFWLKKNGYPSGYRVLCIGCNAAMEPGAEHCELHR